MKETIDKKKLDKLLAKTIKLFNKNNLNISEILLAYGNLGYHLGASIAGFQGQGPSLEDLNREYYRNPTVDVGLMIQGLLVTSWEEDFSKNPKLSDLSKEKEKK